MSDVKQHEFNKATAEWISVIGKTIKIIDENQKELGSVLEEQVDNTQYNYNHIHQMKYDIRLIRREMTEIKCVLNLLIKNKNTLEVRRKWDRY